MRREGARSNASNASNRSVGAAGVAGAGLPPPLRDSRNSNTTTATTTATSRQTRAQAIQHATAHLATLTNQLQQYQQHQNQQQQQSQQQQQQQQPPPTQHEFRLGQDVPPGIERRHVANLRLICRYDFTNANAAGGAQQLQQQPASIVAEPDIYPVQEGVNVIGSWPEETNSERVGHSFAGLESGQHAHIITAGNLHYIRTVRTDAQVYLGQERRPVVEGIAFELTNGVLLWVGGRCFSYDIITQNVDNSQGNRLPAIPLESILMIPQQRQQQLQQQQQQQRIIERNIEQLPVRLQHEIQQQQIMANFDYLATEDPRALLMRTLGVAPEDMESILNIPQSRKASGNLQQSATATTATTTTAGRLNTNQQTATAVATATATAVITATASTVAGNPDTAVTDATSTTTVTTTRATTGATAGGLPPDFQCSPTQRISHSHPDGSLGHTLTPPTQRIITPTMHRTATTIAMHTASLNERDMDGIGDMPSRFLDGLPPAASSDQQQQEQGQQQGQGQQQQQQQQQQHGYRTPTGQQYQHHYQGRTAASVIVADFVSPTQPITQSSAGIGAGAGTAVLLSPTHMRINFGTQPHTQTQTQTLDSTQHLPSSDNIMAIGHHHHHHHPIDGRDLILSPTQYIDFTNTTVHNELDVDSSSSSSSSSNFEDNDEDEPTPLPPGPSDAINDDNGNEDEAEAELSNSFPRLSMEQRHPISGEDTIIMQNTQLEGIPESSAPDSTTNVMRKIILEEEQQQQQQQNNNDDGNNNNNKLVNDADLTQLGYEPTPPFLKSNSTASSTANSLSVHTQNNMNTTGGIEVVSQPFSSTSSPSQSPLPPPRFGPDGLPLDPGYSPSTQQTPPTIPLAQSTTRARRVPRLPRLDDDDDDDDDDNDEDNDSGSDSDNNSDYGMDISRCSSPLSDVPDEHLTLTIDETYEILTQSRKSQQQQQQQQHQQQQQSKRAVKRTSTVLVSSPEIATSSPPTAVNTRYRDEVTQQTLGVASEAHSSAVTGTKRARYATGVISTPAAPAAPASVCETPLPDLETQLALEAAIDTSIPSSPPASRRRQQQRVRAGQQPPLNRSAPIQAATLSDSDGSPSFSDASATTQIQSAPAIAATHTAHPMADAAPGMVPDALGLYTPRTLTTTTTATAVTSVHATSSVSAPVLSTLTGLPPPSASKSAATDAVTGSRRKAGLRGAGARKNQNQYQNQQAVDQLTPFSSTATTSTAIATDKTSRSGGTIVDTSDLMDASLISSFSPDTRQSKPSTSSSRRGKKTLVVDDDDPIEMAVTPSRPLRTRATSTVKSTATAPAAAAAASVPASRRRANTRQARTAVGQLDVQPVRSSRSTSRTRAPVSLFDESTEYQQQQLQQLQQQMTPAHLSRGPSSVLFESPVDPIHSSSSSSSLLYHQPIQPPSTGALRRSNRIRGNKQTTAGLPSLQMMTSTPSTAAATAVSMSRPLRYNESPADYTATTTTTTSSSTTTPLATTATTTSAVPSLRPIYGLQLTNATQTISSAAVASAVTGSLRAMITGDKKSFYSNKLRQYGVGITEDYSIADVLVVVDLRRTLKLLTAISRGISIVTPAWIDDADSNGGLLSANFDSFMPKGTPMESKYGFVLEMSLRDSREAALDTTGTVRAGRNLLSGYKVYSGSLAQQPAVSRTHSQSSTAALATTTSSAANATAAAAAATAANSGSATGINVESSPDNINKICIAAGAEILKTMPSDKTLAASQYNAAQIVVVVPKTEPSASLVRKMKRWKEYGCLVKIDNFVLDGILLQALDTIGKQHDPKYL